MIERVGLFKVLSVAACAFCLSVILIACTEKDQPFSPETYESENWTGTQPAAEAGSLNVPPSPQTSGSNYIDREVLVVLNDDAESSFGAGFFSDLPVDVLQTREYGWGTVHQLEITDSTGVPNLCDRLRPDPRVRFAEPNFKRYFDEVPYWPNDPMWEASDPGTDPRDSVWEQWGPAKLGASIVWNDSTGDSDVVVAVIDTGILSTHEDHGPNLWTNDDEIAGNGIDDDANGYIDDTWGWNCWQMNNDPTDDGAYAHWHGTGCAGVIGAVQDNNVGISGIAPGVKLMAVKVYFANNWTSDLTIIEALNYVAVNDADVVSMSFGGDDPSALMEAAINAAWDNGDGCMLLASAGNTNTTNTHYPAWYDNVICVGATIPWSRWNDPVDERRIQIGWESWWWGSNYGDALSIMGFGERYYSTYGSGPSEYWDGVNHWFFNGTSCACPTAAATMALIKSFHPSETGSWYWTRIEQTSDDLETPGFDIQTGNGRVNTLRAVYGSDRFSAQEDSNGFVPITGAGDTLFDSIHDVVITNPHSDTEDLYKIQPASDGCMTVTLDIYTWGENLDIALYSDVAMTNLIDQSTIVNHYNSSYEYVYGSVVAGTDYYLRIYSPALGNSTTYGVTVEYEPNDFDAAGTSISPVTASQGWSDIPMLKLDFNVDCAATLDELVVHLKGSDAGGTWGMIWLYEDTNGSGALDSGDTLIGIDPLPDLNTAIFTNLNLSWDETGPLTLFITADLSSDAPVGSLIYVSIESSDDITCVENVQFDPTDFPISNAFVSVV